MACFSLSLYHKGKNKSYMSDTGVWLDSVCPCMRKVQKSNVSNTQKEGLLQLVLTWYTKVTKIMCVLMWEGYQEIVATAHGFSLVIPFANHQNLGTNIHLRISYIVSFCFAILLYTYVSSADVDCPVDAIWFTCSKRILNYIVFGVSIMWLWVYLMKVIPESYALN